MNRLTIKLTAGFATLVLVLSMGCTGLSHLRNDLAIQGMAKRSFARQQCDRSITPYSRDYERGWRQAYYDISRGLDGCPPSVPPETYWSTKYQSQEGCKHIVSWYDGYRTGAAAALAECRGSFSKIPVMANCTRPSAVDCNAVEPLRHMEAPVWDTVNREQSVDASDEQQPVVQAEEPMLDRWTMPQLSVSSGVATRTPGKIDQATDLPEPETAGPASLEQQSPQEVLNPFATPVVLTNNEPTPQFTETVASQTHAIERVSAESDAETLFPMSSRQSQRLPAAQ